MTYMIIQIEANGDDQQLVDANDEGEDVLVVDEVEADYNPGPDDILVTRFLESGCGCKENCCGFVSADELLHMRLECAEIDHYHDHTNTLDQLVLGQLRCLTSDSTLTTKKKKNQHRETNSTSQIYVKKKVCL